jgi:hypothetical protein
MPSLPCQATGRKTRINQFMIAECPRESCGFHEAGNSLNFSGSFGDLGMRILRNISAKLIIDTSFVKIYSGFGGKMISNYDR